MNNLLPFMQFEQALSLDLQFENTISVEESLKDAFTKLCLALDTSAEKTQSSISFSVDSYDEKLFGDEQKDLFVEQIRLNKGVPHAKICHMRLYETEKAAHWHALFAQMDEHGNLQKLVITDSRTKEGRGITAQKDIETYSTVKNQGIQIHFIPGLQQPGKIPICWMHALANLAALATTGAVYKRQKPTGSFSKELRSLIEIEPPTVDLEAERIEPEVNTTAVEGAFKFSDDENLAIINDEQAPQTQRKNRFFGTPPKNVEAKKAQTSPTSKPEPTKSKTSTALAIVGGSLLLASTVSIVAAVVLFPINPPLSITLVVIGLILALTATAMLIGRCLTKNNRTEEIIEPADKLHFA